ncbi:phospholipid-binding protein, PBP family [Cylindrospermum stagnale PCC 7417]|uniref:Phospholipid-binding protein, PBP family n=1 Tax=Cylindrospermum stagnale PCC 7417 TaxID=56107 RepID=K9X8L3_9NOST|nr:YbhB/YbcL family Raf kinase inhibitor-like protein [Cylindrospermum stagnale]AFZ27997.1 phospholipid-binding protein, PBP family [Cylindrospermum stagnale PCC 7417]
MSGRRVFLSQNFAIFGLVGLSLVSCRSANSRSSSKKEAKTMKLASSAFEANNLIPAQYTCDGADISPPLIWEQVPRETQSLALIVDDPDAPGKTFVHWVVYDLPPTVRQLPEQISSTKTLPNGGVQGKNDFGKFGYGGPCPPSGIHRYFFQLYALDKKLGLAAGASKNQILAAIEGHILASSELIGRYKRQR